MKRILFILSIAYVAIVSCSKNDMNEEITPAQITVSVSDAVTKTQLKDNLSFEWKTGDQILLGHLTGDHTGWEFCKEYVFTAINDGPVATFSYAGYYLWNGAKKTASFPGFATGEHYSVVYRTHTTGYCGLMTCPEHYISADIPTTQTYVTGNKYGIGDGLFELVGYTDCSSDYPTTNIKMRHIYAVIKLNITAPVSEDVTITDIQLSSTGSNMFGRFGWMSGAVGSGYIPIINFGGEEFVKVDGPYSGSTSSMVLNCNDEAIAGGEDKDFGILAMPAFSKIYFNGSNITFTINYKLGGVPQTPVSLSKSIALGTIKPGKVYTISKQL